MRIVRILGIGLVGVLFLMGVWGLAGFIVGASPVSNEEFVTPEEEIVYPDVGDVVYPGATGSLELFSGSEVEYEWVLGARGYSRDFDRDEYVPEVLLEANIYSILNDYENMPYDLNVVDITVTKSEEYLIAEMSSNIGNCLYIYADLEYAGIFAVERINENFTLKERLFWQSIGSYTETSDDGVDRIEFF